MLGVGNWNDGRCCSRGYLSDPFNRYGNLVVRPLASLAVLRLLQCVQAAAVAGATCQVPLHQAETWWYVCWQVWPFSGTWCGCKRRWPVLWQGPTCRPLCPSLGAQMVMCFLGYCGGKEVAHTLICKQGMLWAGWALGWSLAYTSIACAPEAFSQLDGSLCNSALDHIDCRNAQPDAAAAASREHLCRAQAQLHAPMLADTSCCCHARQTSSECAACPCTLSSIPSPRQLDDVRPLTLVPPCLLRPGAASAAAPCPCCCSLLARCSAFRWTGASRHATQRLARPPLLPHACASCSC